MTRYILSTLFIPLSIFSVLAQNNLQRSVYFDKDQSTLKPQSETSLLEVMDFLNKNPTFQILLKGFTDADGSDDHNRALSERRVQTVRQFLEQKGVNTAKITTLALGKAQPIANNATEEGKQQNRRVDINVTFVQKGKIENLSNLYRELASPIQTFKINTAKDTTIRGAQGTVLIIPKNAFAGVPNGAVVDFTLNEVYLFSDMIRNNLNTMSDDKILQTGGMIYTGANYNGKRVELQSEVQVQFNSKESKLVGMQLFSGERNMQQNGDINWLPIRKTGTNQTTDVKIYARPGRSFIPYLILNEKTNKPLTIKELCDTSGCYPLVITSSSKDRFTARPNISNTCGTMSMYVQVHPEKRNMPIIDIHREAFGEAYTLYNVHTFDELMKQNNHAWDSLMTIRFDQVKRQEKYLEMVKKSNERIQQYENTFPMTKLGWINCDSYRAEGGQFSTINILSNGGIELKKFTTYKVILKRIKSVLGYNSLLTNRTYLESIPTSEPFIIIALKIDNGNSFIAIEEGIAKDNLNVKLNFKQMSTAEIKEKLKVLDN